MIPELRDLSCEERLKECGLTIMETRRLRGDQTEVSEIVKMFIDMFCSHLGNIVFLFPNVVQPKTVLVR